jgi:hypothetical protein
MKKNNAITILGNKFGRWTVVSEATPRKYKSGARRYFSCQCSCGVFRDVEMATLLHGRSLSCGCLKSEMTSERHFVHGENLTNSKLYRTWSNMIQRCENKKNKSYYDYGGRGIRVYSDWTKDGGYKKFKEYVITSCGLPPSNDHQIDRIDNDAGYNPGNIRWVTRTENARNKRSNRKIRHNGSVQCLSAWADSSGLRRETISKRLKMGWGIKRALSRKVCTQ